MGYVRFNLAEIGKCLATVATVATVHVDKPRSVATVATVAGGIREFRSEPDPERVAILASVGGVPAAYIDAFAALMDRCPPGVSKARWRRAVDDAGRFLDQWGEQAVALGWAASDLFDWSPVGCSGLAWELDGREVVALTADCAVLGPDDRTERAYFAKPTEATR